jgi:IPTL-CTERM motif
VLADPIPAMSDLGLLVLVALIALLGVWMLATRKA